MYIIENEYLKVELASIGAELRKVYDKKIKKNRMWSGDPDVWGRVSPILFPIVGKVKEGSYLYEGKEYKLPQHGFLRDQKFAVKSKNETSVTFTYTSDKSLYEVYPFKHKVEISYLLEGPSLKVSWTVKNLEDKTMHYSIGAHPAFALDPSKDYEFLFPNEIQSQSYGLNKGLLGEANLVNLETLSIQPKLFDVNTIIYDNLSSVVLQAKDNSESVQVNFEGFPFLALWAVVKNEGEIPFVCIEPWHGIVDEYTTDQDFSKKLGSRKLKALDQETLEYEMVFNEK